MSPRAAAPRRIGLLEKHRPRADRPAPGPFTYAVGHRIAGDLIVTGHLATGRLAHLYQVWSASEWCSFTCKILAPGHAGSRAAAVAMAREHRILEQVRHPNLVRLFGAGQHDGLPFALLEYLEGPSLFDVLERKPERRLSRSDAVRAAIHVASALYHLHNRGYLHLDLKPANLLLRGSMPVLIDFDTARPAGSTARRERMGTAPYMAPEQVLRGQLGAASDVYGLGALLYELLTGRWPFEDVYLEDEPRSGDERQYPQIGASPPPPPGRYYRGLPRSLQHTVMTCLARDPADRFNGMHPLLLALARELEDPVALWPAGIRTERRYAPRV